MQSLDLPRFARDRLPAGPLPASADAELIAQFDARIERMFAVLGRMAGRRGDIVELRHALHQVAGTAAFFGKSELGTLASTLDRELGDTAQATDAFLADAGKALRRAALGEG